MNSQLLDAYAPVAGQDAIHQLRLLSRTLQGKRVVHLNSTREGGGVAEILRKLVPLQSELGLDVRWEVIEGTPLFFQCTKQFHNCLQGHAASIPRSLLEEYESINRQCAKQLGELLGDADFVFVHDPQPAAVASFLPKRKGKWIWRCHIDVGHPHRPVWRYLREFISHHDATVFSLADFAQMLPHPVFLIPPSIDPLSDKNIELSDEEIAAVHRDFGTDPSRPLMLQVSRFDRFKDPLGVIRAHELVTRFCPGLQLVLAGGGAADDPEGESFLAEVQQAAAEEPDIKVVLLPPDAHRKINALQRASDFLVQKSLREGFGLTVSEALWKGKAVIGGNTGGIRLQVIDHHTGFLVNSPEGLALRVRYLLHRPSKLREMGAKGREFVRENFLITRQLREYLTMMLMLVNEDGERLQLG